MKRSSGGGSADRRNGLGWLAGWLFVVLSLLFFSSYLPGKALFANDGPLGVVKAAPYRMPDAFLGIWNDLFWIGFDSGMFLPNIYGLMLLVLGPLGYINFAVPISLSVLGLCAGLFFRVLGFRLLTCVLGGLAAALNGNFFSNGCWGLPSRATGLGMIFLALAALYSSMKDRFGLKAVKTILAGLAIGMAISESGDNGAIFSLFVAAFALFLEWQAASNVAMGIAKAAARGLVMAVCAAVLAFPTLNLFVSTAYKGVAGIEDQSMSPEERWSWATQWSLPKIETLRVVIPGLYGYRMDTAEGGNYWGRVGQQPGWEEHHQGIARYSGAGEYAGVLVVLLGVWALAQACRKQGRAFTDAERKLIWFWSGLALVALVLAWGRHAPLYRLIYALPYFSTIRNPMKFMHPFHMILMILFACGVEGLCRLYLAGAAAPTASLGNHLRSWWAKVAPFEKRWTLVCGALAALAFLAWLLYGGARPAVVKHLMAVGFPDEGLAKEMARFSAREVGLFALFLAASVGAVTLILSGALAGARARWAGVMLGVIMVLDLARANAPWIVYYNYTEKYATNPLIEDLREKPYEARVTMPPFQVSQQFASLQQVYHVEWLQHHFQFYNIQSLDIPQEPRMAAEKKAYRQALATNIARLWQLTNTRYVFWMSGNYVDALNQQLDPAQRRFRARTQFTLSQSAPGAPVAVQTNATGPFALVEFTGALPRARLYSQWEVITNAQASLARLADPAFDPLQTVIVSDDIPPPSSPGGATGTVEFVSYAPQRVELRTQAAAPSLLLLNDKFDPNWQVLVDGQPAPLLRCNFLVRGVQLTAGAHTVTFRYAPPRLGLKIMTASVILGLVLCGIVVATRSRAAGSPAP